MSLLNLGVVDIISTDPYGNVVLTISDEFKWDKEGHLLALQDKINAYLAFIESENIYQEYPNAKGKSTVISVVAKYEPDHDAKLFLEATKEVLQAAGYNFKFSVMEGD